jgi:hypothetical protein
VTADEPVVVEVSALDDAICTALAQLIPQLSSSAAPLTAAMLEAIVASPATTLFVAKDASDRVLGTLTLALFPTPTGVRAWIEDVVVDISERGQGTGARSIDLTSKPERTGANSLYRKLGFAARDTNVYRFDPS